MTTFGAASAARAASGSFAALPPGRTFDLPRMPCIVDTFLPYLSLLVAPSAVQNRKYFPPCAAQSTHWPGDPYIESNPQHSRTFATVVVRAMRSIGEPPPECAARMRFPIDIAGATPVDLPVSPFGS